MQKNLNRKDVLIRAILGLCAIALYFLKSIDDVLLEMILGIIGFLLIISAFVEFCPVYYFLGIKTRQKRRKKFY